MLSLGLAARRVGLQRRWVQCVGMCSVSGGSPVSKRRAFKANSLDMSVMYRLDAMNVGMLPKRKMRVAVAKKLDPRSARNSAASVATGIKKSLPFPFYSVGKVHLRASEFAKVPATFPGSPPEIALIGRSNVGKSTLVNALLRFDKSYVQKAIVSEKPGETKHLTFYELGLSYKPVPKGQEADIKPEKTPAMMLVDMPGYGFAFMSEEEKVRCHYLCLDYLTSNVTRGKTIKRAVLLLDGRHGLKATDVLFLQDLQRHLVEAVAKGNFGADSDEARNILESHSTSSSRTSLAAEYAEGSTELPLGKSMMLSGKNMKMLSRYLGWKLQIVLTKCDIVERAELCKRITSVSQSLEEKVPALYHSMLPTLALSAKELRGVEEMQRDLAALIPPMWEGAPNYKKLVKDEQEQIGDARKLTAKINDKGGKEPVRLSFEERRQQRLAEATLAGTKAVRPVENKSTVEHAGKSDVRESDEKPFKKLKKSEVLSVNAQKLASNSQRQDSVRELPKAVQRHTIIEIEDDSGLDSLCSERGRVSRRVGSVSESSSHSDPKQNNDATVGSILSTIDGVREAIANESAAPRKTGRIRRPLPVRRTKSKSDRAMILEEYGDELAEYIGVASVRTEDEDDVNIDWKAAGEDFGNSSDEEESILEAAFLAGNMGNSRSKVFSAENRALARSAAKIKRSVSRSGMQGVNKMEEEDNLKRRAGKEQKFSKEKLAAGAAWPRRVPKTPKNPKGRHRLHVVVTDQMKAKAAAKKANKKSKTAAGISNQQPGKGSYTKQKGAMGKTVSRGGNKPRN